MSSNVKVLDLLQPCLQSVQSHISTSQAKINFNITALPPNQREREREEALFTLVYCSSMPNYT